MENSTHSQLDSGMRGWIVNKAKKEFWRVKDQMDFDDLVQDGYFCYAKCCRAYPKLANLKHPTKDQRRHFQALVKTTFDNHISTLAAKHRGVHVTPVSQLHSEAISEEAVWDHLLPSQPEQASLLTLLESAPAEIKQLAQLLAGDGMNLLGFQRKQCGRRKLRETTNEMYCRLLGLDPKVDDMAGWVQEYFETC